MPSQLSPSQQQAFDLLKSVLPLFPILGVVGHPGSGKSTVLRRLFEQTGGEWISMRELLQAFHNRHPLALEEGFHEIVDAALKKNDHVYLDDFFVFANVVQGGCHAYPRSNLVEAVIHSITALVESTGKKLII